MLKNNNKTNIKLVKTIKNSDVRKFLNIGRIEHFKSLKEEQKERAEIIFSNIELGAPIIKTDSDLIINYDRITFGYGDVPINMDDAVSTIHTHYRYTIPSSQDFMSAGLNNEKYFYISLKNLRRVSCTAYIETKKISFRELGKKLTIIHNKISKRYDIEEDRAGDNYDLIIHILEKENNEMDRATIKAMRNSVITISI